MKIHDLIYGPISEDTSDALMEEMLETLRSLRDIPVYDAGLRKMFDVQTVCDDEGLPVYTPRLVDENWTLNHIADADPYLNIHYPEFFQPDDDILSVKKRSTEAVERLRTDGKRVVERFGILRVERIPVRGDVGAIENLVSYRDWSGNRHEVGESQLREKMSGLLRTRKRDIDLRIEEILLRRSNRQLPKKQQLRPDSIDEKTLQRIRWVPEKLDQMIAWAIELHRSGLVQEQPNEILFHCQCNFNVYDTEGRVLHSAFENRLPVDQRLHWTGSLGDLLLMVKFLNERKFPSAGDPVEKVVDMRDGDFYVHFYFLNERRPSKSRPLNFDEAGTLAAIRKDSSERATIFKYWKDGSPFFKFLEREICGNESDSVD